MYSTEVCCRYPLSLHIMTSIPFLSCVTVSKKAAHISRWRIHHISVLLALLGFSTKNIVTFKARLISHTCHRKLIFCGAAMREEWGETLLEVHTIHGFFLGFSLPEFAPGSSLNSLTDNQPRNLVHISQLILSREISNLFQKSLHKLQDQSVRSVPHSVKRLISAEISRTHG